MELVSLILLIILGSYLVVFNRKKYKINLSLLKKELNNFDELYQVKCSYNKNSIRAVTLNESLKKLAFITEDNFKLFNYKDILSCEITEDNNSIIKTSRSSQFGGALLGGVLLGGVGTIIGGLSGKKYNIKKVKNINLSITVNDIKNPIYEICFLNKESDTTSIIYKESMKEAKKWHSIIKIIIKKVDEEDKKNEQSNTLDNSISISEELRKLKLLLEDGLLTDDEFNTQKNKLLNK